MRELFLIVLLKENSGLRNYEQQIQLLLEIMSCSKGTYRSNTGIITEVLDRRNYILRKASNLSKHSQIIAANIDQVFLMVTIILPETPVEFIDRFLITAEAYRVPAKIIINKTDLYGER